MFVQNKTLILEKQIKLTTRSNSILSTSIPSTLSVIIFKNSFDSRIMCPPAKNNTQRLKCLSNWKSLAQSFLWKTSVCYLKHMISHGSIITDPDKISALTSWPVPKTLKELKSFLSYAGCYRRFSKNYSTLVKPLQVLTSSYLSSQKKLKAKLEPEQYLNPKDLVASGLLLVNRPFKLSFRNSPLLQFSLSLTLKSRRSFSWVPTPLVLNVTFSTSGCPLGQTCFTRCTPTSST